MVSEKILSAMRQAGGIRVEEFDGAGGLRVGVNFRIISEQFPGYLEEIIKETINEVDREFYDAGLIAYTITNEGHLLWKPTLKWLNLGNAIIKP